MYQASEFSKSGKLQRDPKALPEQLRYWLLADEFDLHLDRWGMGRTCTETWKGILPVLQHDAPSLEVKSMIQWPDLAVRHLLVLAHAEDPAPFAHTWVKIWDIFQRAIQCPVSGVRSRGRQVLGC
jgi:hypothetical protein